MRRLAAVLALAAVLTVLGRSGPATSGAAPARDELPRAESELTYDVRPDEGSVHVTWHVDLQNNDPQTTYEPSGTVLFYDSFLLPILRGASNVRATGPGDVALAVSLDDTGEDPLITATVSFDHVLYYHDRYALTLSYDLAETRSDVLLISPAYVYLPAIAAGDESTVRVRTPAGPDWDVTLEPIDCVDAGGEFRCGASQQVQVAALVEVIRPDALQSIDATAQLERGDVTLRISYFPGEERWAAHVRELAQEGLPLLEELYGVAYRGPRHVVVAERGRQEIAGYEGTFNCFESACEIGLSPVADDGVALHEFAHLWTEVFASRWLAEGLAEFMSRRAGDELGDLVLNRPEGPLPDADLYLDDWGNVQYLIGADDAQLDRELAGYVQSRRLFERLERAVGLPALQQANAASFELGEQIDSETYLDLLEEASGEDLAALFLEEVFPPSFAPVIERRREVRDRFAGLRLAAGDAGLAPLRRIDRYVRDWRFDEAEELLSDARGAVDAYLAARERVDAPRSLWAKLGLIGRDPDGALRDAEDAFAQGDYDDATSRAHHAQDLIDGAGRAALVRLLAALGALVGAAALVAAGLWFARRRRRERVAADL
ncbi:MAG: hypothetical protein HY723_05055 [Chloroflexi bacterium]|nr:hypothetical protein [Chloroflexota bacterium]